MIDLFVEFSPVLGLLAVGIIVVVMEYINLRK
jgi:hypothetical protein